MKFLNNSIVLSIILTIFYFSFNLFVNLYERYGFLLTLSSSSHAYPLMDNGCLSTKWMFEKFSICQWAICTILSMVHNSFFVSCYVTTSNSLFIALHLQLSSAVTCILCYPWCGPDTLFFCNSRSSLILLKTSTLVIHLFKNLIRHKYVFCKHCL